MLRVALLGLLVTASAIGQSTLTTTFVSNNGGSVGGGVYFDLTANTTITITGLDLNLIGTGSIEVYTTPGTRLGVQTTPASWTLVSTGTVTGAVSNVPAQVLIEPFELPVGSYGIALKTIGVSHRYTNGTGSNQNYSTPELALAAGEATNVAFTAPVLTPRVVNANIRYVIGRYATLPPFSAVYNGVTRGFNFTAQASFNIATLSLPPEAFQAGDTASYLVLINNVVAYYSRGNAGAVSPFVHVNYGDVVDVLGNWSPAGAGSFSAHNSYTAAVAPIAETIHGVAHTMNRSGWQWDIGDPTWNPGGSTGALLVQPAGQIGRVIMTTTDGTVVANNTSLGTGCVATFGSLYEYFGTSAGFDLANSALSFIPNGSGGYNVSRIGTFRPVGSTSVPTVLGLGDDTETTVPFTLGSFPGWTGVTICSNGFVSQATGNGVDFTPNVSSMLNAPQTAFWSWHDYNPSGASGKVKVEQATGVTVITWDGVYDFATTNPNTMQFQFYGSGVVTICWQTMSGTGNAHLVGYSPGGLSPNPGSTNISAITSVSLPAEVNPPTLVPNTRPVVGQAWNIDLFSIPPTGLLGVDILGLSDPGINDLAFLGMPTCPLRASLDVLDAWFVAGPTHSRSWVVPNNTTFIGIPVYAQSAVFQVPPINAFGAITSNGIRGLLGDI